jgi:hypothetical protein
MSNSRLNIDEVNFIPKHKGMPNSTGEGYTHVVSGNSVSGNQFQPSITTFSKRLQIPEVTFVSAINSMLPINLLKHSNNFNSSHINFKIEASLRHPNLEQLSIITRGGVCIDSQLTTSNPSTLEDKFKLDYTSTFKSWDGNPTGNGLHSVLPAITDQTWLFPSLSSPSSPFGIYDLASSGTPLLNLVIKLKIGNPSGQAYNDVLVNGIITLF